MSDNDMALKSNLERALEVESEESIEALSKAETIFFVCLQAGADLPAEHPTEFGGRLTNDVATQIAKSMADSDDSEADE